MSGQVLSVAALAGTILLSSASGQAQTALCLDRVSTDGANVSQPKAGAPLLGLTEDRHHPDTSNPFRFSGASFRRSGCSTQDYCAELAKITSSDVAISDFFGYSVAINNDFAIVGAFSDDCAAGFNCGAAYVYRNDGNTWIEQAKLTASDASLNAKLGFSVSACGDVVVLGAPEKNCTSGANCGAAYVYRFNGTEWWEEEKLTASDAGAGDHFGISVAISEDVVLVGAHKHDCGATADCGATYVYRFDGSTWVEETKLTASQPGYQALFGMSVSVSGNTAVIGAPQNMPGGAALVYRFDGSIWTEEATLAPSDAEPSGWFGVSVAVSQDVAIVGDHLHDCEAGDGCGAAYIFRFDAGSWAEETKLAPSDLEATEHFAQAVATNGNIAVVGRHRYDCDAGSDCGASYIYRFDGNGWIQMIKLTASDPGVGDAFGRSVAVGTSTALVGAYLKGCDFGPACGAAFVFSAGMTRDDCDCDGTADACEIASGDAHDCNRNAIPDECDLADGSSEDCNSNEVPDECDPDCQHNKNPDDCDIAEGNSDDCNNNGIPDECDMDCQANGNPDDCDIADGSSGDCNFDGRPDECGVFDDCEEIKLTASDAVAGDSFGRSVCIDGNVALVGNDQDDCVDAGNCGAAYVYRFNGRDWNEEAKLTASDAAEEDDFGEAVAVRGNLAVVGAYHADCLAGYDCGAAYVYRFNGISWIEEAKLVASDATSEDAFGLSVAVDEELIAVGAPFAPGGPIYVYRFDGDAWHEEARLVAPDAAPGGWLDRSVAISGGRLVFGAYRTHCAAGFSCGAAYVYRYDGLDWILEAELTASDAAGDDRYGRSVGMNGDTVVVGASGVDCGGWSECGASYVHRFTDGEWAEEARLIPSIPVSGHFGSSVAISADFVVMGGTYQDTAYAYRFTGSEWVEHAQLTTTDLPWMSFFGSSVSVSRSRALVGAFGVECEPNSNCGAAFIFPLKGADCNCNGAADVCDIVSKISTDHNANGIPDECDECLDDSGCDEGGVCVDGVCVAVPDPCADNDGDGRVTICHIPPGNPGNAHTITVSVNAVPAHLAHGDSCGPCEQGDSLLLMAGESEDCSADVNGDGVVNAADLALLLGIRQQNPGHSADFDGDDIVGPFDLATLLGNWGRCP